MNNKYERANSGVLFPQKDKKQDNYPDFTGNIVIGDDLLAAIKAAAGNTVRIRIAGWKKTSDKVGVYLSLSVSADQESRPKPGNNRPYRRNDKDDERSPWE